MPHFKQTFPSVKHFSTSVFILFLVFTFSFTFFFGLNVFLVSSISSNSSGTFSVKVSSLKSSDSFLRLSICFWKKTILNNLLMHSFEYYSLLWTLLVLHLRLTKIKTLMYLVFRQVKNTHPLSPRCKWFNCPFCNLGCKYKTAKK